MKINTDDLRKGDRVKTVTGLVVTAYAYVLRLNAADALYRRWYGFTDDGEVICLNSDRSLELERVV